jgi:hypothetical protein
MRLAAMIMMMAVGVGAGEAEAGGAEMRIVPVCMNGNPGLPPAYPVERMTSEIFATIGVRLKWHDSCPASPDVIQIGFADQAPKGVADGVLAYARPYEGIHIVVLYGRVKRLQPNSTQQVLAYVLVHEITHVLQGTSRHSKSGIMKAHWDFADYDRMRHKTLLFTADDVDLIHLGLDARAARLADKGPAPVAAQ